VSDYSRLDRALHSLALRFRSIRAASFDIERSRAGLGGDEVADLPHVFVAGLARAGTSVLVRMLHQTGAFSTQTYRDMPFVLAPQSWRKLSGGWQKSSQPKERAHRDGLQVDFDSVEAFEEVFWLTFANQRYVRKDRLLPHAIDAELAAQFKDFVAIVVAAHGVQGLQRYLSKNNNNVLRLAGLAKVFPKARFIVPFRDPVQHACSLLRQHQSFSKAQKDDPFILKYMSWLGHFEFGRDLRPCDFGDMPPELNSEDTKHLFFWLRNWTRVYRGVLAALPDSAILWDFDAFCANPWPMTLTLAESLNLGAEALRSTAGDIRTARSYPVGEVLPAADLDAAAETYARLRQSALKPRP
jgi:hypothetical protein